MKVLLKLILDCDPHAAWRAIQSPAVFREASSPFLDFDSLELKGFPSRWNEGDHPVKVKAGGAVGVGEQVIDIHLEPNKHPGVSIVRDSGFGVSGFTSLITKWDHRMAIAADPAGTGKTLYRDRLVFEAGPMTAAIWPSMWAFWQLRGARLKALAPGWTHPESPKSEQEEKATPA